MKKIIAKFSVAIILFIAFALFTLSLRFVDLQPLGPEGSFVAYGGINGAFREFIGVNLKLYEITDWAGVGAILTAFAFALLGCVQWVKRKSLVKVDSCILILGCFYLFVFGVYIFFEYCHINYRPVLINGILESSYPSSTTMLAACVFPGAMFASSRLVANGKLKTGINIFCVLFTLFMVIGRVLSGVHWFTDIFGGLLFSASALLFYSAACDMADAAGGREALLTFLRLILN